jgi:nucleotide-binding universal stress UspA family protein
MFSHLLVPLDGSRLAESALPAAAYIAEKMNATVTLLHIIERNAPKEVHSEPHLTNKEDALRYLAEVAATAFPPDVKVDYHVHTSEVKDVARSIVEHAPEIHHDLIIMCTHGRGGVHDFLFGSIAQQVIALGEIPVLLIRPSQDPAQQRFHCDRLLVPLDGNPEHEQGLTMAVQLAQECGAFLHLVMVVPTFGVLTGEQRATSRLMPGTTAAVLDLAEQGGEEYLRKRLADLKPAEIQISAEVARGEPAVAVVEAARRVEADMIVLGTHGRAGMDAFWSGSVTPRIAGLWQLPILLVPVVTNP